MHILLALLACKAPTTEPPVDATATWHADVRPIVEASCDDCHSAGGLAPFELTWDTSASSEPPPWAAAAVSAVEQRRMPPWPASDDCHPIAHSRGLSPDEIAKFTSWKANSYAPGDPADFVAQTPDPLPEPAGEPQLVLAFDAPFTPPAALVDDYHCLPVGDAFPEDTWVTASRIVPGSEATVHHVIAYLVGAEDVAAMQDADAAEAGPGYTCFGGPLPDGRPASVIAGYVPGAVPEVLAANQARPMPAGSRVVLQMHYNLSSAAAEPDETALELWTRPDAPIEAVLTTGLANYGFLIPAGAPAYTSSTTVGFGASAKIISVLGHMHQRGTTLKSEILHADGTTDCLLNLDRWDFDWQLTYAFPDDNPVMLRADDTVRLTCTWDNTAENQPVVNGAQLEPRDMTWGEGSADEMCIEYAAYSLPAGGEGGCSAIEACHGDSCPEGDGRCITACWERSLSQCGLCVASGVLDCGQDSCQVPGGLLSVCVANQCPDTDLVTCLAGPCRNPLETYLSCQDAFVRDGSCDDRFTDCGVAFGG